MFLPKDAAAREKEEWRQSAAFNLPALTVKDTIGWVMPAPSFQTLSFRMHRDIIFRNVCNLRFMAETMGKWEANVDSVVLISVLKSRCKSLAENIVMSISVLENVAKYRTYKLSVM